MATTTASSSDATDGPVLSVITKRIRALRKKLNRILQMEESVSQGKSLNKEQEETLRSKPYILAAIDELEKLKSPISLALSEELSAVQQNPIESVEQNLPEEPVEKSNGFGDVEELTEVTDLLNLLYFATMFDVKSQGDFTATMLTRTHERGCCLTYDYVADDDVSDLLEEKDLDMLSMLGSLLISRGVNSSVSHKNALSRCIEHSKLWLRNSDQPVLPDSECTYAGLRQKLYKIMASNYFTTAPELRAPVEVAAEVAAYGSYQVPVHVPLVPVDVPVLVEGSHVQFEQEEAGIEYPFGNGNYDNLSGVAEEFYAVDEGGNHSEFHGSSEPVVDQAEFEQTPQEFDNGQQYAPRRSNQNYRGRGGRRGGYPNGRGGRGSGRGRGYSNGRNQYYDQRGGGYYPRNSYYRGRGGGRGTGSNHNYQVGEGGYLVAG